MSPDPSSEIVAIGLDIVDTSRMQAALGQAGTTFRGHVFTAREWADCENRADRVVALAERFAVKEACLKALGSGWAEGLNLSDVSLHEQRRNRSYRVILTGAAATRAEQMAVAAIHVSIAREVDAAAAVVLLVS
jgi:holo-[acyl-carrier protein] synthase